MAILRAVAARPKAAMTAARRDKAARKMEEAEHADVAKREEMERPRCGPVLVADSGDTVIVRSGLTGNEQIATTGSFTLKAEIGKGEASHED